MSNLSQTHMSLPYHDETTDNMHISPPLADLSKLVHTASDKGADLVDSEALGLVVKRFENLMNDLNGIRPKPNLTHKEPPKKPLKRVKETSEAPQSKGPKKRQEQLKPPTAITSETREQAAGQDTEYEDLFKQISDITRGEDRRRGVQKAKRDTGVPASLLSGQLLQGAVRAAGQRSAQLQEAREYRVL